MAAAGLRDLALSRATTSRATTQAAPGAALLPALDRAGPWITLVIPLFLLYGRGIADGLISLTAALFLVRSALARDWAWLRLGWVRVALAWWAWLVACSVPLGTAPQAAVIARFLLFAAALQWWALREAWVREALTRLLRWATFYIAFQCAVQFAFGRNLFGWPRGADGELTGPFDKPRTGPIMARLLFPAVLPLARTRWWALVWLGGGLVLMILIGQRMPLLLTLLGLAITALFLRELRLPVLCAAAIAGLTLLALPWISPQAAHRVETKFAAQMERLPADHYGQIAARGVAMVRSSPVFGVGFDGFRHLCDDSRYFQGWHGDDGGGAAICVQHPHNFYLQAAVEGGIPGLLLFTAMGVAWLRAIGRGLWRGGDRLRVGLFAATAIQLWPIAGGTDWVAMPLSGWFYLQLGLALALAAPYMPGRPNHSQR